MTRIGSGAVGVALGVMLVAGTAWAQTPAPPPAKPEEKPKTLWEETTLFSYIEMSGVWNLHGTGRNNTNELRFYDLDGGYTFNMAEFSVKKDPTERYPFGYGLVLTFGQDAQKNHAIGIFRDDTDVFPFRNTSWFDLQEAYGSYKIPLGSGLTVKAGKFVTLLGYEVIESPLDLNFSRSFMFAFAIPLTHVGALASYTVTDWLTLTAGPVVGWDVADDNNDKMSWTGQIATTPMKDVSVNLNWITGPEQFDNKSDYRTVLDLVANYTGIKNLTLGFNFDYGWENNEASLVAAGLSNTDASWWGIAAYAAYDWTEKFRTALRVEYFQDTDGARTLALGAGQKVDLWELTATAQYKIWKGLVGRVEYRHDDAGSDKVFKNACCVQPPSGPTRTSQDTITFSLYYSFF